ncbi:DUF4352 domain-containing protein [Actinomycetes bacterium KLBMP 9797]
MTTPQYPAQDPSYIPQPPHGTFVAPPPTPRKRRPWLIPALIGGGIVVALCCGGTMVAALSDAPKNAADTGADTDTPTATGTPTSSADAAASGDKAPAEAPKTYRVGQTVRGGDFEFVVKGTKCGLSQVGESILNRKAQGSFCRFDISVKNVTKSAHLFHADGTVTAQDATGREYESDGEANIYGNKDGAGFLDEINPGNTVRAFVYFDVPKGTKLTSITFDAGLFTRAEDAVVTL